MAARSPDIAFIKRSSSELAALIVKVVCCLFGFTSREGSCGKSVEKRWLRPEYNQRNLQYILAPRKRVCLTSVPVADEAAGGGEP